MISASRGFKDFGGPRTSPPSNRILSREELNVVIKHGIQRYKDSIEAGFQPRLDGGPAAHTIGAMGEVFTNNLGTQAGVSWTATPFQGDYTSCPVQYDFEASGWKIDVKTSYNGGNISTVLIPEAQVNNASADIYVLAKASAMVYLLGYVWAQDVKRRGKVNSGLPLPAYEIPVKRLRPVDEFWRLLK